LNAIRLSVVDDTISFDIILINPPFGAHVEKDMRITDSDIPTKKEKELYTKLFGSKYLERVYEPMKEYAAKEYKDKTKNKLVF